MKTNDCQKYRNATARGLSGWLLLIIWGLLSCGCGGPGEERSKSSRKQVLEDVTSVEEVTSYFSAQDKQVVTFLGYSGAGYEDGAAMLAEAKKVLAAYDPEKTIVNIGATSDGIGAVYPLAKSLGFHTTGIVSVLAKEYGVSLDVDRVFFVADTKWGGIDKDTGSLSPTSQAMVAVSGRIVSIGGGEVARDELEAAKSKLGADQVLFIPADMNHAKAIEKAKKKGLEQPVDFRGAAHSASPDS